ncbi:CCA tRNA nucleotidyltransferase [Pontivivens insulae]|uniref:CCA-adding enzyme n=1 Tax=Pontivivens insulae TaxID=1639689 RepID=A0A2R8A726_9RHOB|nr:CCA tRNA nucleotidyltransferase [Pontivivens insulae]RED18152.1 poly(A) polymerase [Pontivivens insulae]SPF28049.1 CCA-adding enzyme [Pontivivens insulae]
MQIDAAFLSDARTQSLLSALTADGAQAYVVGGAVRNALLSLPVDDVDIATSLHPDDVIALSNALGFSPHPTGVEHGTVTVFVEGLAHEVTTFRTDVSTDGRRATVEFAKTVEEDAARRDFTMNALYVDASGRLLDPVNGLPDLKARKVRFIGMAEARIREDYLRILRFFRFHARFGEGVPDPVGLSACAALADGVQGLSSERITTELTKLLSVAKPFNTLRAMQGAGVQAHVIPQASLALLDGLERAEFGVSPDWRRRLLALGGQRDRLRLSKADQRYFETAERALASAETTQRRAYRYGPDIARDLALVEAAILRIPPSASLNDALAYGAQARFPITAQDLMPTFKPGRALGQELKRLEELWIASDFTLDQRALLQSVSSPDV